MKYTLILTLLFLLLACSREVKQPELTKREKLYFDQLQKICKCEVSRGIVPKLKSIHEKNTYAISLIGIDETKMKNKGILKKEGFEIAKRLNNNVLRKNLFDEISIFYFAHNIQENHMSEVFVYDVKSLR